MNCTELLIIVKPSCQRELVTENMAGVGVIDYLTSEEDKLVIEDGDVNTVYRFLLGPAEEEEIVEAENKLNLKVFKVIEDEVEVDVGEENNGVPLKRRKRQKGRGRLSVTTAEYKCRFCNKAFTQAINLASHERIHTGERPFVCKICLKRFTQQPNLWKHIRVHTGERPYRCSMCRKSFTQQANLDKHFMTHTGERPYDCSICGKCFSQQANLTKHVRLHTGERPYACPYCPKTFVQRSNLQRHCRVHTGERPYACKLCPKAYAQHANLATHSAIHHRSVPFADVIEHRNEQDFIMMGVTPLKSEHSKSMESGMSKRRGIPVLFCTKTNTIIKRLE